jgi:DNA-binding NtrC family response regulator
MSGGMMSTHTVLYISDDLSAADSYARRLKGTGLDLVTARSASDAAALLFVNRRVEAVVLDQRKNSASYAGLARVLKSFRDIPIILVSTQVVDPLPTSVDALVCLNDQIEELPQMIEAILGTPDALRGRLA